MNSVLAMPSGHFGILHVRVLGGGSHVIGRSTGALERAMMGPGNLPTVRQ